MDWGLRGETPNKHHVTQKQHYVVMAVFVATGRLAQFKIASSFSAFNI